MDSTLAPVLSKGGLTASAATLELSKSSESRSNEILIRSPTQRWVVIAG